MTWMRLLLYRTILIDFIANLFVIVFVWIYVVHSKLTGWPWMLCFQPDLSHIMVVRINWRKEQCMLF